MPMATAHYTGRTEKRPAAARCPLCGAEMKQGVIQSGGVIFWGKKERSLFWYRGKLKDEISILGSMLSDDGPSKLADICQNCQVVLVYYGKKWDDERWNR